MVKKVEDEPVSFSVTNHAPAEIFWKKSKRINPKRQPLDWTNRSVGTFHRAVLESSNIHSQVGKS